MSAAPWIDPDLRARFAAMHGADVVERAERRFLFASALAVYQAAGARREAAEDRVAAALADLEAARALESDWCAITHGLAVGLAQELDAQPARVLLGKTRGVPQTCDDGKEGDDPAR